jgi:hypothetical protein
MQCAHAGTAAGFAGAVRNRVHRRGALLDGDIDRNCLVGKPFRRDELFKRIQACMGMGTSEGYADK